MPQLVRTTATETHRQEINTRTRSFISEYAPESYDVTPSSRLGGIVEGCLVNGAVVVRALFYCAGHLLMGGGSLVLYAVGRIGDGFIYTGVVTRKLEAYFGGGPKQLSPVLLPWLPGQRFEHKELGTGDYEVDVDDRSKEEAR